MPQNILLVKKKIERAGPTLEQLGTKIRLGIATGYNNAFILDSNKRSELIGHGPRNAELVKPVLRGRDIYRYGYVAPKQYILLTRNGVDVRKDYPTIYQYLRTFGPRFRNRGAKGEHWTNLRACSFFDDFSLAKIIWIELSDVGRFALCTDEIYLLNTAYFLLPSKTVDTAFLLGVLNSTVIRFYMSLIAATSGMGTNRWINHYVKQFPIPSADRNTQESLSGIVHEILSITQSGAKYLASEVQQDSVRMLESEIDLIAYRLYGLNEVEACVIEEYLDHHN